MSPSVEPFNEAKYKALMDGLECSEVSKSKLERTLRIDSEFFSKKAIETEMLLAALPHVPLTSLVDVSDGNHAGISEKFIDEGIPYYRGQDAGTFFIESSTPICIDEETFNAPIMHRSHLKKNDVLLSIVGTIGSLSLVYSDRQATCSCKLAILRPKDSEDAELLAAFLNSKYGRMQVARFTRGAVQKGLILEDMDQLVVPSFGEGFKQAIKSIVTKSYEINQRSKTTLDDAKNELSNHLDIDLLQENYSSISIKRFSQSYGITHRLDAEYYQLKYDKLTETLNKYECNQLGGDEGIVSITKSIEPGSDVYQDGGIPFIRVSDINEFEISEPKVFLPTNIVDNAELLYPQKDTILFSKDGSIGIAYKVEETMQVITSGALLHLVVRDVNKVLPDYLTLVLNSPIVQLQAERDSNGAIIQHWKPSDIEKVVIPILDIDIQEEIAAKVQESFALRRKSKELLEYAKQAVELAIEQGENHAIEWLKNKV